MKWFRANIRHGSRLALLALAIQFALSFGHFHAVATEATGANQYRLTNLLLDAGRADSVAAFKKIVQSTQAKSQRQQPVPGHDSGGQSDDACAICAVVAMANAVLFATPPLLPLLQATEFLYCSTDAEFVHLTTFRVAFQPRAPPIS
jgi:Protein of unknown function (DUF2946)